MTLSENQGDIKYGQNAINTDRNSKVSVGIAKYRLPFIVSIFLLQKQILIYFNIYLLFKLRRPEKNEENQKDGKQY